MIPAFTLRGALPPGIHDASIKEVESRYAGNPHRDAMFRKLVPALKNLKGAGVETVYLDGSFVRNKPDPGDIDGCWDAGPNTDVDKLDPVFLDFEFGRARMKDKYFVDFFISQTIETDSGVPFVEFFQTDRDDIQVGLIRIDLTEEDFQ